MQYTEQSIELAISIMLPEAKESMKKYTSFNIRDALEDIAVNFLIQPRIYSRKEKLCLEVTRLALKDLRHKGYIEFGDKSLSDELSSV